NFISTPDGIYVAYGKSCRRLDPVSGRLLAEFPLAPFPAEAKPLEWGYLNVHEDYLVAGAGPVAVENLKGTSVTSSKYLLVMNRHTGKVQWTATARTGFRHNGVCIGGGRLYAIDRPIVDLLSKFKRKTETAAAKPRLLVWDLATGKDCWSTEEDIFG